MVRDSAQESAQLLRGLGREPILDRYNAACRFDGRARLLGGGVGEAAKKLIENEIELIV